jgi:hypothetical protein
MCSLLAVVMPRLPDAVLRTKFNGSARLFSSILDRHRDQAGAALSLDLTAAWRVCLHVSDIKGLYHALFGSCVVQYDTLGCLHLAQAATIKAALTCLSQLLAAMDPASWPNAAAPFGLLVSLLLDARPKVRKRAQTGVAEVLAALQRTPALAPASDALLKGAHHLCHVNLAACRAAWPPASSAEHTVWPHLAALQCSL